MSGNTFSKRPDVMRKAVAAAHTPEARAKAAETNKANRLIRNEIFNNLKESLLAEDGRSKKTYYSQFLDKFLAEAKRDPNSKAGQMVAQTIFHEDILEMLDEQQNRQMARDLDFMRFRAQKRLFHEQRNVVEDVERRRKLVICSRRAGKTDENVTNMVYTAITPNSPILYINLKFDNAIKQAYDGVIEQAENIGLVVADGTSKSSGLIVFENGSSITFSGNNNNAEADKLRGGKYRLVIIDEVCHQRNLRYLINEVIDPALMDYEDSQLVLTGTPPRIPHTYAETMWNSDEYFKYHWTMYQNPYIHNVDEEIKRICKDKGVDIDSPFIQREYFGKMGAYDTEAQVFKGRQFYDGEITYESLPFSPTNVCVGVDFGFSDNNAVIGVAYNKSTRESCIFNQKKFNKATISEIINNVNEVYEQGKAIALKYGIELGTVEVFCDNNERSIVSEMSRNYNINAHTCWKYDKSMAIEQLAEELRTGRMKMTKGSILDDEMEMTLYKRDDATDAILPEIDDDVYHPDAIMALLYASRQMFLDFGYDAGGRSKEARGEE